MSLWRSVLLKVGLLALTLGTLAWIGWGRSATSAPPVSASEAEPLRVDDAGVPAAVRPGESPAPQKLDLNRATAMEFERLPGVGPVLAQRMVAYRNSIGRFQAVEELDGVKGIGKKKLDQLKPFLTVAKAARPESGHKEPL